MNFPLQAGLKVISMCIIVITCSLEYALALPALVIPIWWMAETLKTKAHISAKTHIGSFQAS